MVIMGTKTSLDFRQGLEFAEFQRQNVYTAQNLLALKDTLTPEAVELARKLLVKSLDRLLSVEIG